MGKLGIPHVPQWWAKENKGLKSVVICPTCHAIYYDKHWHTWSNSQTRFPLNATTRAKVCRACETIDGARGRGASFGFEGELILRGLVSGKRKQEIIQLVRNVGARAVRRDPGDQIIKIEDKGASVRITTTENQLALSIGKQVDSAFKGGTLKVRFSKEDLPVRVYWDDKE